MGHAVKRICLPSACDTPFAVALHEDIVRELSEIGEVQIDASAVDRINTPAIQVLLMLARALNAENIPFSLEACSPPLAAGFEHLGLGAQLAQWRAA